MENKEREQNNRNLLNGIIAETISRDAKTDTDEFLKKIGFEGSGKTEGEAVRISMYNVLMALTREIIALQGTINMSTNTFKAIVLDEDLTEQGDSKDGRKE